MFGFLVKKWFFDMWDNLYRIVILNLGFLGCVAFLLYIPYLLQSVTVLFFLAIFVGIVNY